MRVGLSELLGAPGWVDAKVRKPPPDERDVVCIVDRNRPWEPWVLACNDAGRWWCSDQYRYMDDDEVLFWLEGLLPPNA